MHLLEPFAESLTPLVHSMLLNRWYSASSHCAAEDLRICLLRKDLVLLGTKIQPWIYQRVVL